MIIKAIVVSNNVFNEHTKMSIVCPISSNIKDFPTHYKLEDSKKILGSVFCEHARSIDYEEREMKYVEKASDNDLISFFLIIILSSRYFINTIRNILL